MIITSLQELQQLGEKLRAKGQKIVWTNGCFDILQPGHVYNLEKSKALGDVLIVGMNGDDSPYFKQKPGRPVQDEKSRLQILEAIRFVDHIYIFNEETPVEPITTLKPDIITKGGDYQANKIVGYDIVNTYGGKVEIIPFLESHSTTNIIEKILKTYS